MGSAAGDEPDSAAKWRVPAESGSPSAEQAAPPVGLSAPGPGAWWRQLGNRAIASDPGLVRLSMATTTVVTLGVSLGVLYGTTQAAGQPFTVAMLGVVISMISSMAFKGPRPAQRAITTAFMLVIAAATVTLGALLAPHKVGGDVVFVAIMAAATAGRRFGPRAASLGMAGFMTYFFALFLGATLAMLPWLIIALVIGTAVSLGMTFVLREHPDRQARRALRALQARVRLLLDVVADALANGHFDERDRRRLARRIDGVNQASLMVDGLLDDQGVSAIPDRSDVEDLKLGLFDVELAAEALIRSCWRAAADEAFASPRTRAELAEAIDALRASFRHGAPPGASARAEALAERIHTDSAIAPAYRTMALAVAALTRAVERVRTLTAHASGETVAQPIGGPPADTASDGSTRSGDDDAAPAPQDRPSWIARVSPSTRQTVQVTIATSLAIVAGELLSSARWYWAVIAAFVIYSGTTSRGEVLAKGRQRIVGTVLGVAVGAVIGSLAGGNVVASLCLIFASLFVGFYLMQVSYAFMVIGTTTMLALLYGLLGEFSLGLLATRIEETAIGAAIGIVTALVVLPTRTRATVATSIRSYLIALGDLVEAAGNNIAGVPDEQLTSRSRVLDRNFAALRTSAKPLTAGVLSMRGRNSARRGLSILGSCEHYARSLARVGQPASDPAARDAFRRVSGRVNGDLAELADMFDHGQPRSLEPADDLLEAAQITIDTGSAQPRERGQLTVAMRCLRHIDLAVVDLARGMSRPI
jgi:uncharacterized membrane protein YccC